MKNNIFKGILLILILCLGNNGFAENVDTSIIKKVAFNAFHFHSSIDKSELKIIQFIPVKEDNVIAYYIINLNKGHIVIAADNIAKPILGFGFSTLNVDNAPPALMYLLNTYKEEILYAKNHKLAGKATIDDTWDLYSSDNFDNLPTIKSLNYNTNTYLIETTWAQDDKYNMYCPYDPAHYCRTLVGCGAVALGQILKFWSCRVEPQGIINYTPPDFDEITINLSNQNYNWYAMNRDTSDIYNSLFLYHCAAAIKSEFGCSGTESNEYYIWNALRNYFGFNAIRGYKSSYIDAAWIALLKDNIDLRRPIIYCGMDNRNPDDIKGHGWVVDGYRSDDLFHCNWGWRGHDDGWYSLNNLTPDSHYYNDDQHAVLNIYPIADASDITIENATLTVDDEYDGRIIIIKNTSIGNNAHLIFDADCITEIYGPFGVSLGSTLEVK